MVFVAAALFATLGARTASAAEVVPLPPVMEPAKAGEIISLFHTALADGLKAGGLKVVAPKTVLSKLKLPPENAGCAAPSCLGAAITAFGANRRYGAAHITTVGKNYKISVFLFSGKKAIGTAHGRCDICTLHEALKKTRKLATDVGSKGEEPPSAGGTAKKPTHKTVKKPKSGTGTKTAKAPPKTGAGTGGTTGAGTGTGAATTTTTTTTTTSSSDTGRPWPLWPALVSAGVGVVGLVVGIPLLAINGNYTNCQGPAAADGSNCADIYSTSGGGWLMTGLGIAGVAASGVLFYLYFRSKGAKTEKASIDLGPTQLTNVGVVPTSSGVVFGASGRF